MKILFDTNVVLDVLLARPEFIIEADALFAAVETHRIHGYLCATTLTTIHYLTARERDRSIADLAVSRLLLLFTVAPVTFRVLSSASALSYRDYEDAVLHEAGRLAGCDGIVTRNTGDFRKATLPIYSPPELIAVMGIT